MAGRGAFNSRIGFIMAAVGSAVGLGNLWRFPYLVSENGGATFVLLYLAMLFLIGLPALMAELSLGRRAQKSAVQAFQEGGKTKAWGIGGYLAIAGAIILLSYYSVIAGWALKYFFSGFTGAFFDDPAGFFGDISTSSNSVLFHLLFMAMTIGILVRGVGPGIEKANLIMMPILFLSIVALVIYGNVLEGAHAGREFYIFKAEASAFKFESFDQFSELMNNAAGQTFFSVGLGIGTMLTYSSYMSRDVNLQTTGLTIGLADTGVALLAGFMVFPILFAFGLDDLISGPSSVGGLFIVLPSAFAAIGGALGIIFGVSFFLMLSFAALSSALSLLEVPVSTVIDRTNWGRTRAVLLVGLPVYILGIPSAISTNFFTFMDDIINNILLLLGGLVLTLYVGWVRPDTLKEMVVGTKNGLDWSKYWIAVIRYPLPVLLTGLLGLGLYNFGRTYLF
ncbi:MAG: sodium-dependent transporter [Thermoplasmatota archaeon]